MDTVRQLIAEIRDHAFGDLHETLDRLIAEAKG